MNQRLAITRSGSSLTISRSGSSLAITRYGSRYWAVWLDGQLLAVTLYKKGATAITAAITRLSTHPGKEGNHATQAP